MNNQTFDILCQLEIESRVTAIELDMEDGCSLESPDCPFLHNCPGRKYAAGIVAHKLIRETSCMN